MPNESFYARKNTLIGFAVTGFLLLCVAYSNHFTNPFEFDDFGSIVNNGYIRHLSNIPLFFTDIKSFGTNMGNLGYRPMVALLNAIAYRMGGGLNPVYFHASIFFWYLVQLVLMFTVFRKIFAQASIGSESGIISLTALVAVAFYGVHAANAETINYLISISDSFSTLCIVASLLLYMLPTPRKYYLYLITTAIAIGTKETGVMFGPILFIYILLFEENVSLVDVLTFRKTKKLLSAIRKSLPALLFSFGLYFLIQKFIVAPSVSVPSSPHTASEIWQYFYSQWVIICHYIGNFVLPLELSIDTTFVLYPTVLNRAVLLSLLLLLSLVAVAVATSNKKATRPIAFGILWFFIALAPTSSFIPLAQISNDHRTFFPYIGLVMSLSWCVFLLLKKHHDFVAKNSVAKVGIPVLIVLILSLHAYGTYQRNIVWSSPKVLWHDAAIKGPENGRAQMNYGLELMSAGKYAETLPFFERALKLMPNWAYININMGILRDAMGFPQEAEMYFRKAIYVQPFVPEGYYYYARWLKKNGRIDEAIAQLEIGVKRSPAYIPGIELLKALENEKRETTADRLKKAEQIAEQAGTPDNYNNLSFLYYKSGMFKEAITASQKTLNVQPKNAVAYNNMCSAYCALRQWGKAVDACTRALQIDPGFELAKNNLKWARDNL